MFCHSVFCNSSQQCKRSKITYKTGNLPNKEENNYHNRNSVLSYKDDELVYVTMYVCTSQNNDQMFSGDV